MTVSLDWPAAVPLPSFPGYSIKPRPNVDSTDVEIGQARVRRRSTTTTDDFAFQIEMTRAQFAIFEAWFKHRAMEGAAWFNVDLLAGLGLSSCETRFKPRAELSYAARNGERWVVTGTFEVRNRPMMSDAELTVALGGP